MKLRTGSRGKHHQAHDRCSADGGAVSRHGYLRVVALGTFDEFRGRARMQTFDVADDDDGLGFDAVDEFGHLVRQSQPPESSWLATLMYFLPASRAMMTASPSGTSPRMLASLTRIGRL